MLDGARCHIHSAHSFRFDQKHVDQEETDRTAIRSRDREGRRVRRPQDFGGPDEHFTSRRRRESVAILLDGDFDVSNDRDPCLVGRRNSNRFGIRRDDDRGFLRPGGRLGPAFERLDKRRGRSHEDEAREAVAPTNNHRALVGSA
jgi:hypothetical protein